MPHILEDGSFHPHRIVLMHYKLLHVSHYKDAHAARNTGERVMQYHKIDRLIESSNIVGSTVH